MNKANVETTMAEARRFLAKAEDYLAGMMTEEALIDGAPQPPKRKNATRERTAVIRSSMDLSRSLVDLRRKH